jgi:hypothetical protein
MTLANREMSQMVSLARANGYDATDFDDFETDRKRSKIIIRALRPEFKAELATTFASRRDRTKFDMYVGCSSMTDPMAELSVGEVMEIEHKGGDDERLVVWAAIHGERTAKYKATMPLKDRRISPEYTYKIRQQLTRWARVTLRSVLRGGQRTLNGYVVRSRAIGKRPADGDEDGAVPMGNKHQRASQPDERPQRQSALPAALRRTATAASPAVTTADRPTATAATAQQATSGKRSRQKDGLSTKRRRPVTFGQGIERFLSPLPASTGQPCPPQEHPAPLPPCLHPSLHQNLHNTHSSPELRDQKHPNQSRPLSLRRGTRTPRSRPPRRRRRTRTLV